MNIKQISRLLLSKDIKKQMNAIKTLSGFSQFDKYWPEGCDNLCKLFTSELGILASNITESAPSGYVKAICNIYLDNQDKTLIEKIENPSYYWIKHFTECLKYTHIRNTEEILYILNKLFDWIKNCKETPEQSFTDIKEYITNNMSSFTTKEHFSKILNILNMLNSIGENK